MFVHRLHPSRFAITRPLAARETFAENEEVRLPAPQVGVFVTCPQSMVQLE